MSSEEKKDLVLHYANLAVEDIDNLRTQYGAQKDALEWLEESRRDWIQHFNNTKGELEATRSKLACAKQSIEELECQASQLLLDKANLQRDLEQAKKWHCGGCWNEDNLQKQLEHASSQLESVQMLNKKFREGEAGLKLAYDGQVRSNFELTNMVTDLKAQLLDATKQSDSHYSRAQRLEGELEQIGVKYSAQQCCYRILEQSGQEAAKQRDEAIARAEKAEKNYARCNDNWIETTRKLDQAEKELATSREAHINYIGASGDTLRKMRLDNEDLLARAKQAENKLKFLAECLDERAKFALALDRDLKACRKERDDWESLARSTQVALDDKAEFGQLWYDQFWQISHILEMPGTPSYTDVLNKAKLDHVLAKKTVLAHEESDELRSRVSELTSLLANKDQVIDGLKTKAEEDSKILYLSQCTVNDYIGEVKDLCARRDELKSKLAARPKVYITVSHSSDVVPEFKLVGEST